MKEVLRRWQSGHSARSMERAGIGDRETVGRYLFVQERPLPEPSEQWRAQQAEQKRIEAWLFPPPPAPGEEKKRPLRLTRIHELLARDYSVNVGYTTLRRFALKELGFHKKRSTVRIADCEPGEEAQMDFGLMGTVVVDGVKRELHALIIKLVHSRYMFVWPTLSQTVDDVGAGLDGAWRFFDGVVKCVIPDNASSMIVRAHPTSPTLGRSFAEYVQARDFYCDAARVEHPQDKARVENQVAYVRERWFDGESFSGDLVDIRKHAAHWCDVRGPRGDGDGSPRASARSSARRWRRGCCVSERRARRASPRTARRSRSGPS